MVAKLVPVKPQEHEGSPEQQLLVLEIQPCTLSGAMAIFPVTGPEAAFFSPLLRG
jgi:hypothetical protein